MTEEQKFEYYYYYFKNYKSKEFPVNFEENNLCWFKNCDKLAIYTRHNYQKPMFCSFHKENGMKLVSSKKICEYRDCIYPAIYLNLEENKIKYCGIHKNKYIRDNIDKKYKDYPICIECKTSRAIYGYKNSKEKINCKNCKKDNMINISYKSFICIEPDCLKIASFGNNDKKLLRCRAHKLQDMVYNKKRK